MLVEETALKPLFGLCLICAVLMAACTPALPVTPAAPSLAAPTGTDAQSLATPTVEPLPANTPLPASTPLPTDTPLPPQVMDFYRLRIEYSTESHANLPTCGKGNKANKNRQAQTAWRLVWRFNSLTG